MLDSIVWDDAPGFKCSADDDTILILSKSVGSETQEVNLPKARYALKLKNVLSSVNENTLPALSAHESKSKWKLKAFMVGVGLEIKAGFGPIAELKTKPKFRLIYTRKGSAFFPEVD